MAEKKENRGGKREGAGRKLKFDEETITVSYRIPETKKDDLDKLVNKQLTKWASK